MNPSIQDDSEIVDADVSLSISALSDDTHLPVPSLKYITRADKEPGRAAIASLDNFYEFLTLSESLDSVSRTTTHSKQSLTVQHSRTGITLPYPEVPTSHKSYAEVAYRFPGQCNL